jgi:hypothetical protein
MENAKPHKVIVKLMSVSSPVDKVYAFFEDVKKSMEAGKAAKSVTKGDGGWWTFDHVTAGPAKLRHTTVRTAGVIDHTFSGGGLEWTVFVRIVPNKGGSTTTWTFIRPDGLTDEQFEEQLKSFDHEIELWKQTLESP